MSLIKQTILSETEKAQLVLVEAFKGGEVWRSNRTLYYLHPSSNVALVYGDEHLDYLIEWGRRPLELNGQQKGIIATSGFANNIPVQCTFTDGTSSSFCFIQLTHFPPSSDYFEASGNTPRWYYLYQVAEMTISPRAVPKLIIEAMKKMEKKQEVILNKVLKIKGNLFDNAEYEKMIKQSADVVVQDATGRLYKFNRLEQVVYTANIDPQSFQLVEDPRIEQISQAVQLSNNQDYDGRRIEWKPPVPHIIVFADATH